MYIINDLSILKGLDKVYRVLRHPASTVIAAVTTVSITAVAVAADVTAVTLAILWL